MKATIIKYSLLLPLILFLIWTGLSIFGCVSCFFDVGDDFYCTKYCMISKVAVSLILLTYGIFFARAVYAAKQQK